MADILTHDDAQRLLDPSQIPAGFDTGAFGLPATPANVQMYQQANQPNFDLMGAVQQAQQQYPMAMPGFLERLAQNLGGLPQVNPTSGQAGFAQGLQNAFVNAQMNAFKRRQQMINEQRDTASKLAEDQYADVRSQKTKARDEMMQQANQRANQDVILQREQTMYGVRNPTPIYDRAGNLLGYGTATGAANLGERRLGTDLSSQRFRLAQQQFNQSSGSLTPEGLDVAARNYAMGAPMPPFRGKDAAIMVAEVVNRAAELYPQLNITANKDYLTSQRESQKMLQRQYDNIAAYEGNAIKNSDMALASMSGIPDTDVMFANRLLRGGAKEFGSTKVAAFQQALAAAQPEWARIVAGNGNLSQQLTNEMINDIKAVQSGNYSKKQLRSAIDILKQDAENRKSSLRDQIIEVRSRYSNMPSEGGMNPPIGNTLTPGFGGGNGMVRVSKPGKPDHLIPAASLKEAQARGWTEVPNGR